MGKRGRHSGYFPPLRSRCWTFLIYLAIPDPTCDAPSFRRQVDRDVSTAPTREGCGRLDLSSRFCRKPLRSARVCRRHPRSAGAEWLRRWLPTADFSRYYCGTAAHNKVQLFPHETVVHEQPLRVACRVRTIFLICQASSPHLALNTFPLSTKRTRTSLYRTYDEYIRGKQRISPTHSSPVIVLVLKPKLDHVGEERVGPTNSIARHLSAGPRLRTLKKDVVVPCGAMDV